VRPKGVADGKQVNIPVPMNNRYYRCGDAGSEAKQADGCLSNFVGVA